MFSEILANFDEVFVPEIRKSISKMGLTDIDITQDESDLDGVVDKGIQRYFMASYETSKIDSAAAEVKLFMHTILDSVEVDGKITMIRKASTMMPSFVNYKLAWNTVLGDLANQRTVESMMAKVAELAKSKNSGFYPMLFKKLSESNTDFITKFWASVYSHRHQFVNIAHNRSAKKDESSSSFMVIDSDIDRATRKLPMEWGENLIYSNEIFNETIDGIIYNPTVANEILSEYRELQRIGAESISRKSLLLPADAEIVLERFISLFNRIGITVDSSTMEGAYKEQVS